MQIALALSLEEFQANQVVFRHKDVGEKFYIVLKGSVSVMVGHK